MSKLVSPTKQEVVESVCDQIKRIMEVGPIEEAYFQIEIKWDELPRVDAQIKTFVNRRSL